MKIFLNQMSKSRQCQKKLKEEVASQEEGAASTAQGVAEEKKENLWMRSRRTLMQQRQDTNAELHIRLTLTQKRGLGVETVKEFPEI